MIKIKYSIAFLSMLLLSSTALAYELTPMTMSLDEVGRNSSGVFRVYNSHPRPLTLELSSMRRILSEGYYKETEPAEDDFMLMPPQAYIAPGEFQVFRVRYLGNEPLEQSVGYRIIFRQLPVDLAPVDGTGVSFLMHVHAPVYVSPVGVESIISADIDFNQLHEETRFETHALDLDNPAGVIVLNNSGNGVEDLSVGELRLTLESGETRTLKWTDFSPGVTVRHILPGGESRIPVERLPIDNNQRIASVRYIKES